MSVETMEQRQAPAAPIAAAPRGGLYWYTLYGLRVRSDVRLPMPSLADGAALAPDLTFRLAPAGRPTLHGEPIAVSRCHCPTHNGAVVAAVYQGAEGTRLWYEAIGVFAVTPDARRVDVYPDAAADEQLVALLLAGRVATYVLQRRGRPSLHASAVVLGEGAIAFLGPHGQGKSTMAASFLRRGHTLLTDDVLPLQSLDGAVCGGPSLPIMKVWRETAEGALHLADELPGLTATAEKKLLTLDGRYALAPAPVRLRAVYVLDRYDPAASGRTDARVQRLGKRESVASLLAQTYGREFMPPAAWAGILAMYAQLTAQAPVRVLTYPHGFSHQGAVYDRILADLEAAQ